MLIIRPEHREALRQAAMRGFEDEMVEHCFAFSPRLCKVLGEPQVRVVIRRGIETTRGYGLTNRGPVRLYIELMFLLGSGFGADPQYPWVKPILDGDQAQMDRADALFLRATDYLEQVHGPDSAYLKAALEDLAIVARHPLIFSSESLVPGMLEEMARTYPQKAAYLGEPALRAVIDLGIGKARTYGFADMRATALLIVLIFAFGHGFDDDPLYPWIKRTLHDDTIVDAAARAKRLETKAVTWLDRVLATAPQGRQP